MSKIVPRDPGEVRAMFQSIAKRYDLVNSLMTFSMDNQWRARTVQLSGVKPGDKALDCATGTGDLALLLKNTVGDNGSVSGIDFSPEMLRIAKNKAEKQNLPIDFKEADMLSLPFDDNTFDAAVIGFGIRNLSDPKLGISEMARVVHPGGRIVILETGNPTGRFLGAACKWYRSQIVTRLGAFLTKTRAYHDLEHTSSCFPCGTDFISMLMDSDQYSNIDDHPQLCGSVHIYVGTVR